MPSKSKAKPGIGGSNRVIRRYPRRLEDAEAGAFEKLMWRKPQFMAEVVHDEQSVDFVFRIPISQLPRPYRVLRLLFLRPHSAESWGKAFRFAYPREKYGGKALPQFMANPLHQLFIAGIEQWLKEPRYSKSAEKLETPGVLEKLNREAQIKRNQPDPRVALWAARRRPQFLTAIASLRKNLRDRVAAMNPVELRREISKVLPYRTFLAGLRKIAPVPNSTPQAFFNATWVSTRSMVEAMLTAELEAKGCNLRRISLKTYLKAGEKLVTALSSLPKQHS